MIINCAYEARHYNDSSFYIMYNDYTPPAQIYSTIDYRITSKQYIFTLSAWANLIRYLGVKHSKLWY